MLAIGVWAAPGRQGTVPVPLTDVAIANCVSVTLGTVQITVTNPCATGTASLVADPASTLGPVPNGSSFLADVVTVRLDNAADINVCYPYTKASADKSAKIYKWDEATKSWVAVDGTVSGNPGQICFVDKGVSTGGSYALIGTN